MRKLFSLLTAAAIALSVTAIAACGHEHTYSEEWTSDSTNHWHAATCEHTDEVNGLASHTYDGGVVTKEATCTEKGVKTYTCTVCGYSYTEDIAATGHTYDTAWTYDETSHWHASTCADKSESLISDKAAHTLAETCTDGVYTYTCSDCGYTEDGTEAKPYTIGSVTDWQKKIITNYAADKYWKVTEDLDFSNAKGLCSVYNFSGTIDFDGHTVSGMDLSHCGTYLFYSSYGGLFYKTNGAIIENLSYKISPLAVDNSVRVVLYVCGDTTLDNVTTTGSVAYDDNNTSTFVYAVWGSDLALTFNNCTNYADITNAGGNTGIFLGKVYEGDSTLSGVKLEFKGCKNYGTVYSAGNASMLISNACTFKYTSVDDLTVENCVNYGKLYHGSGSDNNGYLLVGGTWTTGNGITEEQIKWFETEGTLENGTDGEYMGSFETISALATSNDGASYTLTATEGATYYTLTFSFWVQCYNTSNEIVMWGTDSITITFDNLSAVSVYTYDFTDGTVLSSGLTESTTGGDINLTVYTDNTTDYYVWYPSQSSGFYNYDSYNVTLQRVLFTAYDADGVMLSMAMTVIE